MDRTTNEYQGQEFFKSVSEKYASQSGCEWKIPMTSSPRSRAALSARQQVLGAEFIAFALFSQNEFSSGTASVTSFPDSPLRPSMAPQHSFGVCTFGVRDHCPPGFTFYLNHSKIVRLDI